MKYIMSCIFLMCFCFTIQAQEKKTVTDLPDVSVIGNFLGTHSDENKSFQVNEIEFAFQHYLYPSVKADIFTALHKESNGQMNFELEEGYVTFSDIFGTLSMERVPLRLGSRVGKKLIPIGKDNVLHPEQRDFVDKPLTTRTILNGEEGLSAEGLDLYHLLPTPFFSQLSVGYWDLGQGSHDDHGHEEEHSGVEYSNKLLNTRLWNSFALSQDKELELGLNYLLGNASTTDENLKQDIVSLDLTYFQDLNSNRSLKIQSEYYHATYGEEGEKREAQTSTYLSTFYKFNPFYRAGIRYSTLGKHGDEGHVQEEWSFMLTRQLTETSKFRVQYNTGKDVENVVYAQFIFGMGPHSHVLQ